MSANPHHRPRCGEGIARGARPAPTLFARGNPFLDAVWDAREDGLCISGGCPHCGALGFRRRLAAIDRMPADAPLNTPRAAASDVALPLATALATLDFGLLRIAPGWYDALDVALFHLRDLGQLRFVLEDWVRRDRVPARILDLVLFRHARYGYPDERIADLWIGRCLDAACDSGDEGLVESLILACPERVGADPRARRAALDAASRSACVRAVVRRLGEAG